MWITNGRFGNTFLLIAKTNPQAKPAHKGMSAFVIEKGAVGLTVSRDIDKLGYKSVETCELHFQDFPVPGENLIGGVEGEGFKQVMTGLEAERINVLHFRLGAEFLLPARTHTDIGIATQRAFFHIAIAHPGVKDDLFQAGQIFVRFLG